MRPSGIKNKGKETMRKRLSNEVVGNVRTLLAEGLTSKEIASRLGVGLSTVGKIKKATNNAGSGEANPLKAMAEQKAKLIETAHRVTDAVRASEIEIDTQIEALQARRLGLRDNDQYREAAAILRSLEHGLPAKESSGSLPPVSAR